MSYEFGRRDVLRRSRGCGLGNVIQRPLQGDYDAEVVQYGTTNCLSLELFQNNDGYCLATQEASMEMLVLTAPPTWMTQTIEGSRKNECVGQCAGHQRKLKHA